MSTIHIDKKDKKEFISRIKKIFNYNKHPKRQQVIIRHVLHFEKRYNHINNELKKLYLLPNVINNIVNGYVNDKMRVSISIERCHKTFNVTITSDNVMINYLIYNFDYCYEIFVNRYHEFEYCLYNNDKNNIYKTIILDNVNNVYDRTEHYNNESDDDIYEDNELNIISAYEDNELNIISTYDYNGGDYTYDDNVDVSKCDIKNNYDSVNNLQFINYYMECMYNKRIYLNQHSLIHSKEYWNKCKITKKGNIIYEYMLADDGDFYRYVTKFGIINHNLRTLS